MVILGEREEKRGNTPTTFNFSRKISFYYNRKADSASITHLNFFGNIAEIKPKLIQRLNGAPNFLAVFLKKYRNFEKFQSIEIWKNFKSAKFIPHDKVLKY